MRFARRGWLIRWLIGCLIGGACGLLTVPGVALAQGSVQQLMQAQLLWPDGQVESVRLPDSWAMRGLPMAGQARYRLTLDLPEAAQGVWALYLPRVSDTHELVVNGVLLQRQSRETGRPRPVPALMQVPPGLLRAGPNVLEVAVDYGIRGGLSPVHVGPLEEVRERLLQDRHRDVRLPQALNLVALTLAATMALLWLQRRGDQVLGSFSVLACMACARNLAYFDQGFSLPAPWPDLLFFVAQVLSAYLLARLALAMSEVKPQALRRLANGLAPVLLLLGVLATATDQIVLARRWLYPTLLLMVLPALGLMVAQAWRRRGWPLAAVVIGAIVVSATGVHDYFYSLGLRPITESFWLPHATPVFLAVFSFWRLRGLMLALARGERLNRLLEQRVHKRTQALQHANAVKSAFLAAASHDLRQPILAVSLMVGMAQQRAVDAAQSGLLDRAQLGLEGLQRLMGDLLDLSRLSAGAVKAVKQTVALQPLLDELHLHLQGEAAAQGLALRVRGTALAVRSDPVLLAQVLRNLAGNAVRHTRRGGVLIAARSRRGEVWVEVWDSGPGIAPEHREAIFEEFVHLPTGASPTVQGWGLGLAIVRQSLALLHHPLELDSRPGQGSRFRVRLPRA